MSGSPVVDLRETYGAAFIGLIVSTVLYGVTITQTWIYYWKYRGRDSIALKGFVAFLLTLDTLHTTLVIHALYWYLIMNFGNVNNLDIGVWSIYAQTCVNGVVGYLVQLFYARRVYFISKSFVVPVIVAILGGFYCSLTFLFTVRTSAIRQFSHFGSLKWVSCAGLSAATGADIVIAVAMCWYLYHKKTGFARTDSMIMSLMTYSINTGLLTSILATCSLLTFAAKPTKLYAYAFYWLMGKCYVNSFLAMLNNRQNVGAQASNTTSSSAFPIESFRWNRNTLKSKTGPGPTGVSLTVDSSVNSDLSLSKHSYGIEQELCQLESGKTTASVHDRILESSV